MAGTARFSPMARRNSNCSLKPQMAQANPRVHVLKGEYPCCVLGQRKLPSFTLKMASCVTCPRTSLVVFLLQAVSKKMRESQGPQRTNRIDEQGMRTIEGMDEATALNRCPAMGLYSATCFQCELVEAFFPVIFRKLSFLH